MNAQQGGNKSPIWQFYNPGVKNMEDYYTTSF